MLQDMLWTILEELPCIIPLAFVFYLVLNTTVLVHIFFIIPRKSKILFYLQEYYIVVSIIHGWYLSLIDYDFFLMSFNESLRVTQWIIGGSGNDKSLITVEGMHMVLAMESQQYWRWIWISVQRILCWNFVFTCWSCWYK